MKVLGVAATAVAAATVLAAALAAPARAEPGVAERFQNVRLWVQPEYDDPRLLVMMEGDVPADTLLPTTVRFLVPTGAQMYSAGSIDSSGNYSGGPPQRIASAVAGWDEISYQLTSTTFRVEYYQDAISGQGDKTSEFALRTLLPADSVTLEVQQPYQSSAFSVTPAASGTRQDEHFTYFQYVYGTWEPDKALAFTISYTKPESRTSVDLISGDEDGGAGRSPAVWVIIGVIGAVAAGASTYVALRSRRPAPAFRRTPTAREAGPTSRAGRARPQFCPHCGDSLEPGDAFCSSCGAEARRKRG